MTKIRLNIGCGADYKDGWINMDTHKDLGADEIYVLPEIVLVPQGEKFVLEVKGARLPYEDNSVDEILCSRVLEDFLYEYVPIVKEFHRVLKKDGKLTLRTPYKLDVRGIRHTRFFDELSFRDFYREGGNQYGRPPSMFKFQSMRYIRHYRFFKIKTIEVVMTKR